ncbi:MAG: pantoate--beta-alanine ligase [Ignavibacteriales bacterium]|nr:MAG: pantoate--beta-alanine ligase [Ignavibacteriaceae bacterium]MBW7872311.1 pantoate--beta-alanine ligase [Ignavibacteria bacterium]MCZ2142594.1 pantoate--beta-alanine ligase [Ignavibacteriales bacterium]OQY76244.1 MAG: pantoate--beta-alanine ligase [Ignavibacteriales bacterium UTCHB3]MBV6445542.1 Pantothenate synthetase [Ignavibacteriaceae bacterium]
MKIVTNPREMQNISRSLIVGGKTIGFVPTMGYLHAGHLSLVKASRAENDFTVVSIFVNPTQFAPNEDFSKYPRDMEKDEKLLVEEGVDYLFYPSATDIYPSGFETYVEQEKIAHTFEGEFRPTHFRGVTTIVSILFNIVQPTKAYFGQKDAQQCAVLSRMVKDLWFPVEMVVCPIVREEDGLALSSRNVYLNKMERQEALILSKTIEFAKNLIREGERDTNTISTLAMENLEKPVSAKPDYFLVVKYDSFESVEKLEPGEKYFLLAACSIGKTRLIDNAIITV